jgi:hypothetical protein
MFSSVKLGLQVIDSEDYWQRRANSRWSNCQASHTGTLYTRARCMFSNLLYPFKLVMLLDYCVSAQASGYCQSWKQLYFQRHLEAELEKWA